MSLIKLKKEVNALIDLYKNRLKEDHKDSKLHKHIVFDEMDIDNNFMSLKRHIKYSFKEYDKERKCTQIVK
nr:hypothetical protein [uncultured Mediterranean phage uvMED]